jgi:hypothetical protein
MHLAELKPGLALVGLEPERVCTVVAVNVIAENAVQVIYRLPEGAIKERLLGPADEATIAVATVERPWAFDGDAAAFQLACEAKRIDLAFLFDPMMAVHTSNVEPLPHQITAVYESMLPRQPLRFVLADDPGAGLAGDVGWLVDLSQGVLTNPVGERVHRQWANLHQHASRAGFPPSQQLGGNIPGVRFHQVGVVAGSPGRLMGTPYRVLTKVPSENRRQPCF